ncbi:MAG: TonB family protein [Chryseolinea sp.]
MNALLNYLIETNFALCLMMAMYFLLLRTETDYNLKRVYLILSLVLSAFAPLIHINLSGFVPQFTGALPSLGNFVPTQWLPGVVVYGDGVKPEANTTAIVDAWYVLDFVYAAGVTISLIMFIAGVATLLRLFSKAKTTRAGRYVVLESDENRSSFSFFKFIYIGQAGSLSVVEKEFIIRHEQVHAARLHSVDTLLINVVAIFFWFNPVLRLYKQELIKLHEYEADALAIHNADTDQYCSLLAKVALLSADYRLANHFSNSLTVKRINMIRTLKSKIKMWKVAVLAVTLPCLFFVVACQDQINEMSDLARNSTSALFVPDVVQARYDELREEHPKANYIMLEFNDEAEASLVELEKKYGIPKFIELFTPDADKYKFSTMNTGPEKISVNHSDEWAKLSKAENDLRTYAIIEYNETTAQISENPQSKDEIFTIVEKAAQYPGGMDALVTYLASNVRYVEAARVKGIEGTSYVQFVVNKDGSTTDVTVYKSLSPELDGEALRVVKVFPHWIPASQNGKIVRERFIMPITFKLGEGSNANAVVDIKEAPEELKLSFSTNETGGVKTIYGQVTTLEGEPLIGTNVILAGTTTGATTDANGNFELEYQKENKAIVASFVGYKTLEALIR